MQWTSKLKTIHTWGNYHPKNPLKCIEHLWVAVSENIEIVIPMWLEQKEHKTFASNIKSSNYSIRKILLPEAITQRCS